MSRKIVLDTNCLVQIISAHSPYRPAWQAFREGRYMKMPIFVYWSLFLFQVLM